MKKALLTTCLILPLAAFAAKSGPYITAGAGYGFYNSPSKNLTGTTNGHNENHGNMWQIDAGYRFAVGSNWLIGFETGYVNNAHASYEQYAPSNLSGTISQSEINALLTADIQFNNGATIYAKAGEARVRQEISTTGSPSDFTNGIQTQWRPKAVIGTGYNWKNGLGLDIELSHVFGKSVDDFPITGQTKIITTNAVSLNFIYSF